jgi:hypothetical protein
MLDLGNRRTRKSFGGKMRKLDWLTLLFIALKLTHVINWSWWLVLAPEILVLAYVGYMAVKLRQFNQALAAAAAEKP